MIRLVVQEVDSGAACHVGGPVNTDYMTVDVSAPELEELLRRAKGMAHYDVNVLGAELIDDKDGTSA